MAAALLLLLAAAPSARTIDVAGADSAAIAAAIAAAEPGDTVRLPDGTTTLSEPIRPKSGIRLLGAGQDQTRIRYGGEKPGVLVHLGGLEDVEVAGFTLDGENDPKVHQGIAGGNARRLFVHHVAIRNLVKSEAFGPHGILFSGVNPTRQGGVTDSVIADCTFENIGLEAKFGGAIRLAWGSSRNRVERCVIRNTGRGGIFGDNGSTDLVIRGNTVEGSGGEGLGIEVWGDCDGSVIEDNTIDHWLSIGGSSRCAVRRNTISAKDGTIKFIGIEAIGDDLVVTDNLVDDGQQIGISVSGRISKNNHFYGYNTIRSCVQWGAQLQGEESGIARHYFYRCVFEGTTVGRGNPGYPGYEGHGFRTNGNCRGLTLEECQVLDNGRYGVQLGGPGIDLLSFVRCVIRANKGPAVADLRDYTALEWVDCTVEGNGSDKLPAAKPFAHPAPTADFEVSANPRAGAPVTFRSTSKAVVDGALTVLWDLNDGAPETAAEVRHVFPKAGDYRVTLVVWDAAGRGARVEKSIKVAEGG